MPLQSRPYRSQMTLMKATYDVVESDVDHNSLYIYYDEYSESRVQREDFHKE